MSRFEAHSHTHYSNLRLLDCINTPKTLINRAIELGLSGIAITDHECLSSAVEIDKLIKEYSETNPNFKIARGNEIYLINERGNGQKYWHFILIAKDVIGHKMLRELSSNAWINSYYDRGMERVPTLKSELASVIMRYGKGHLIGSTACLGSELDNLILELINARNQGLKQQELDIYNKIINLINWFKSVFEDDFYLEVQPAQSNEQITVNKMMNGISKATNTKIIVTTDAHYLKKEDRNIHKAFLTSQPGDREVDEFYQYAYLQSTEEVIQNLDGTGLDYYELEKNTLEIYNKIENYSLQRNQKVPEVEVINYNKITTFDDSFKEKYPTLTYLFQTNNIQERYWINQCWNKLEQLNLINEIYLSRLEEEANTKKIIGDKLGTCLFAYPIFLQHYIDLMWDCGSPIGAGRGSAGAGLNHYLLGITQTDPIKTNAPWFRYLNEERIELPDIDIDLAPSKREDIFEKIREERGQLGCVQLCTFGTATSKNAIQIACRGLSNSGDEYDDRMIEIETGRYLSSLIPQERGFTWPLKDVVYGNKEKNRKPNNIFVNEINKYPGLLEVAMGIEGLIVSRGIHASGVNFYGEDPFDTACFMKATSGAIITQYSLHDAEYCGDTKFDFLVTQQMDIMAQCIQLLQENGYFEKDLTLRKAYDKYVHPDKIPYEDDKLWDAIDSTEILALFQLNTAVGGNIVRQLLPRNVEELTACNGLMRLTGEDGKERPADRYARLKKDISQWYAEMDIVGLTKDEQSIMEKYCLADYGAPSSQEILMLILMDEKVCGFTLKEANAARKTVAKKHMDEIPALKEKVLKQAASKRLGEYVWETVISPQMSYSFSRIHGYSYSLIACQAAYLATYFPSIYWNTAYLRVISGLDSNESSNYDKIAKGVGDILSHGIKVSLIDINKSEYMFKPDEQTDSILYGMKALNGVNGDIIDEIIKNRPYYCLADFVDKVNCKKPVMISLIKSGAFDQFGERIDIMKEYIWDICNPKKRITMQNFDGLRMRNLLPDSLSFQSRVFFFNKCLKKNQKIKGGYKMTDNYYDFFEEYFDLDDLSINDKGELYIKDSIWNSIYNTEMAVAKEWINEHKDELLEQLNNSIFQEEWIKYAEGSYSSWEMDSLGFYYHKHELSDMDDNKYGIVEFDNLSEEPAVDYVFKRGEKEIPIFCTYRIAGTVIAKEDNKSSISLLTKDSGVVNIKFTRDYYARLNAQLSEKNIDGTKHVVEKSWFKRGTMLIVNGFRRGNTFVAKSYKKTASHQCYKITDIVDNGQIKMTHLRYGETDE